MIRQSTPTWAAALALLLAAGCSKGDKGKPAGLPPLDPSQAGTAAPPSAPAAPAKPREVPTVELAEPEAPPRPDPAASIAGQIVLPDARRGDVGRGDTLFLVARRVSDNPLAPGMMIAVQKLTADRFPLEFALSARDVMIPGIPFEGEMALTARIDKDGDPMTKRKGDVLGVAKKVKVGMQKVVIALDTVQQEDQAGAAPPMANPHGAGSAHGQMPPGHP